jgi:hypothetical protein
MIRVENSIKLGNLSGKVMFLLKDQGLPVTSQMLTYIDQSP